MDVIVERCCGLDVHQAELTACMLTGSGRVRKEIQRFRTVTRDLESLRDWLKAHGCTHVAMEATGVYWIPVYRVLEGHFELVVGNAMHIKNVPGRKTDVKDSEWIARLVRHGLIRKSYVAPRPQQELRDLLRYRRQVVETRTAERNRLLKVLETANIKLSSFVSDVFGASGEAMLTALLDDQRSPEAIAELAKGRLRKRLGDLTLALEGHLDAHHRYLIGEQRNALKEIDARIVRLDAEIDRRLEPYREQHVRLMEIPGLDRIGAATLIAELGVDMSVFPTVQQAAAWAGVCPGNNESAGKIGSQPVRKGNVHLTTVLTQAAISAARTKGTYFRAKYWALRTRRGAKRAALAIAHKILRAAYFVLQRGENYRDLTDRYLDSLRPNHVKRAAIKRLEGLGFEVTLTPKESA